MSSEDSREVIMLKMLEFLAGVSFGEIEALHQATLSRFVALLRSDQDIEYSEISQAIDDCLSTPYYNRQHLIAAVDKAYLQLRYDYVPAGEGYKIYSIDLSDGSSRLLRPNTIVRLLNGLSASEEAQDETT